MTATTTGLRFAPLIRVSTEAQERRGESLRTQQKQIRQHVSMLTGKIPDRCWRYTGQEHATPDQERKLLDRLLQDSNPKVDFFDAVIVVDPSRWSRDNRKSKEGLEILRANERRFFIGTMEIDLYNPQHLLYLGMATEMNEFVALINSEKSIRNRIARAKRGVPSVGGLPYGRTFDRKTEQWGTDEDKKKHIQWAAEQYLKGESMKKIAKALGMHQTYLHRILTERSGDQWEIRFRSKKLNIDETIPIKVPRLLPQKTIEAVRKKARANQTYTHGHTKHKYLLARMIFCGECEKAMYGQKGKYYRHHPKNYKECQNVTYIPAGLIENAVLVHLFKMHGNIDGMTKAIERAIPNVDERRQLVEDKKLLQKQLADVEKERNRIVRCIAKGIITDKDAGREMTELRTREAELTEQIDKITPLVENIPTKKAIRREASLIKRQYRAIFKSTRQLAKMTYEQKRSLVEFAFGGLDPEGRRLGVYVDKTGDTWSYVVRGKLQDVRQGRLPMDLAQAVEVMDLGEALEMFGTEREYEEYLAEEGIKNRRVEG